MQYQSFYKFQRTEKENEQKLKVTLKVFDNVACKYPDTKDYIEENLKEVSQGEGLTVEELIYFVICLCPIKLVKMIRKSSLLLKNSSLKNYMKSIKQVCKKSGK